jgi:importin-7
MRLAREAASQDEAEGHNANLEIIMENNTEEDKIYAAMGVAKTIGTVSSTRFLCAIHG